MKDVPFNPRRALLVKDWVKRHSDVPQNPSQNVQHVVGYWNVIACLWMRMNGIACKCCYKISSEYHAPFKLPSLITKGISPLAVITSYTITLSYVAINTNTIISAANEIMTRLWRECLPYFVYDMSVLRTWRWAWLSRMMTILSVTKLMQISTGIQ